MLSRVISNEPIARDYWRMTLDASTIASQVMPGQFVHVKIGEANDPLLRRPFSVFRRVKLGAGEFGIQIVYKVVGRGTRLLSTLRGGDKLDLIGPLGHGFERRRDRRTHVLVAGGTGSAGLFMLGEEIAGVRKEQGLELTILLGAANNDCLILEKDFAALNARVMVCTDDGSRGCPGTVTELLKDLLDGGTITSDCAVYGCGPSPMLEALATICRQRNIPAQVAVERHMMCGIGACMVCVCRVDRSGVLKHRNLESSHIQFSPDTESGYALVCTDGPVFDTDEVVFDEG